MPTDRDKKSGQAQPAAPTPGLKGDDDKTAHVEVGAQGKPNAADMEKHYQEALRALDALEKSNPERLQEITSRFTRKRATTEGLKKAICLGGGGPLVGLHIGVLEGLKANSITFDQPEDVWALSCIGAWAGVVFNQAQKNPVDETLNFFLNVFRKDDSFSSFPTNTIF